MQTVGHTIRLVRLSPASRKIRCFTSLVMVLAAWVFIIPSPLIASESNTLKAGEAVDVVPFGGLTQWEENGLDYGVMWEDSRDIFKAVITFEAGSSLPSPDSLRL
ncbi:MAG TPA: hypothetical protein PK360_17710, partial [bacterium]|nr:hypothetical protein [bacterium]